MGTCRRTDRQTACGPPTGVPWGHRSGSLGGGVQEGPALLTQAWGGTGGFRGRPQGEPAASSTVEGRTGHLNPQLWGWGEERQEGRKRRTETGGRERVGEGRWGGEGREGASVCVRRCLGLSLDQCGFAETLRGPAPPLPAVTALGRVLGAETGGRTQVALLLPTAPSPTVRKAVGPLLSGLSLTQRDDEQSMSRGPTQWHLNSGLRPGTRSAVFQTGGGDASVHTTATRGPWAVLLPARPHPAQFPSQHPPRNSGETSQHEQPARPARGVARCPARSGVRGKAAGRGRAGDEGPRRGARAAQGHAEAAAGGSGAAGDASELYLVSPPSETLKARRPGHTRTHTEEMHMSEHAPPPDELTDTGRDATPRPTPPRALQGPGACAPHGRHPEGRCPGRPGSVGPGPAAEPEARCSSAGHEGQLTATCPGAGSRRLCALLPGQTVPASSSCLQGEGAEHTRRRHRPHYPSSARAPRLTGKAQPQRPGAWAVLEPSRLPTRPRAESRTQPRPDWTSTASHMGWGGGRGPPGPHPPGAKMASQTRVQPGIAMMRPIGCLQTTGQPAAPCRLPQTGPRPAASGGFTWPWVPDLGTWAGRGLDSSLEQHAPEGWAG